MRFATFFALALMLIALVACTLPAGQYSVHLPADIVFSGGGEITPTREALPTWIIPTQTPVQTVTNTTDNYWNIRSEPRITGQFYETLAPGQTLELEAILDNGWFQVERIGGGSGYIDGRCCIDNG